MPYTNQSKNSATYSYQDQATDIVSVGSPIGLLMALTYTDRLAGYAIQSKNSATYSYQTKN